MHQVQIDINDGRLARLLNGQRGHSRSFRTLSSGASDSLLMRAPERNRGVWKLRTSIAFGGPRRPAVRGPQIVVRPVPMQLLGQSLDQG